MGLLPGFRANPAWNPGWGGVMGGYGSGGMMGGYGSGGMMGGYGSGGMMGGYGSGGMMDGSSIMPWAGPSADSAGQRLTLDQAVQIARDYAGSISDDLEVAEVMEFEDNFYAILLEGATGRGAMEILIDPYRGLVVPEPGPNMMWNEKYGHMAFGASPDSVSLEAARQIAQDWLDGALPGSRVHEHGTAFYGYFTFDLDGTDGQIAGMLSVDADTGAVWLHTWHGRFFGEWEAGEPDPG